MTLGLDTAFLSDFGVAATVGGVSVRGIFDDNAPDAFGIVATSQPVLTCFSADVSAAVVGDSVVVPAGTFSIADIQPDGTGITRLGLKG